MSTLRETGNVISQLKWKRSRKIIFMAVVIRELWEAFSMSILMESAMGTESDILIWGERWMIENNEEETY